MSRDTISRSTPSAVIPTTPQAPKETVARGAETAAKTAATTAKASGSGVSSWYSRAADAATQGYAKQGLIATAKRIAGPLGVISTAVKLPGLYATAARDIRSAVRSGQWSDVNKAVGSTSNALTQTARGLKGAVESAASISEYRRYRGIVKASAEAFSKVAPRVDPKIAQAAAKAVAKSAIEGGARTAIREAAGTAIKTAVAKSGAPVAKALVGSGERAVARAALREGGKAAARAAGEAALHSGATVASKAAGRFVPGANIAIAALDTAVAVSTIADKNASVGKKVTAGVTALGSIAAATNIPVVSQIGAGVSVVSSVIGGFFFKK